jgi:hypothetical protein
VALQRREGGLAPPAAVGPASYLATLEEITGAADEMAAREGSVSLTYQKGRPSAHKGPYLLIRTDPDGP